MSKTQIVTGGIADDAVSEEHLDATAITGSTELAATPADTDEILISDAGTLKRIDFSHIKTTPFYNLITSFSPSSEGSNITIDNCFSSTYDKYFVTYEQLRNGNEGSRIDIYLRTGGSSGSDDGNLNGALVGHRYNNQAMIESTNNSSQGTIAHNVNNDRFYHGYVYFFYPATSGVTTQFQGHTTYQEGGSDGWGSAIYGYQSSNSNTHTGFAIQSSVGNFNTTATRFNVYGITNGA